MKQSLKVLVLGCMTIGALAGCEWGESSKSSQESDSHSSEITSTLPTTSSDSTPLTTSSIDSSNSSASTSSTTSSSTSSSTSVAPVITGITLSTDNVKKDYLHGDKLDLTGLVVTANYDNNTTEAVNNYTTNPANGAELNTVGPVKVTVTYLTFTADFNVTVSAKLTGIAINIDNIKKEYEQGEALDLNGLVVTAKYSDNTTADVTDYTTNPENGTVFNEIKEETITVSYNNFSEAFKVNVIKAVKKDWTSEEAQIMKDHLYDVILPYTGFEQSTVSWDATYTTLYIKGGAATNNDLLAYARALSSKGFVLISDTSYVFRKVVNTSNGDRYIKVTYYLDEDNEFYLEAYDPYVYEFPTQIALAFAYINFGSTQTPPAFAADRYQIDAREMAIYCYTNSTTAAADYTTALTEALWDTTAGLDSETGFYSAVSPDKAYMIYYIYRTDYKSLDIYFQPINFFDDTQIKAFYAKYTNYTIDLPAINVQGASYWFYESENNSDYVANGQFEYVHAFLNVIGGTQKDTDNYSEVLANAGWEVSGSSNSETKASEYTAKKILADKGVIRIELIYNSHDGMYLVFYAALDPLPGTYWPAEEIAAILGSDITDVIPAYAGEASGYSLFPADMWGDDYLMVEVAEGTENDCVAAYKAYLLENNWTQTPGGNFFSPNHQIRVTVYFGTSGSFSIEFVAGPFLEWPAARVARMINDLYPYNVTDVLPPYVGGESYNTEFYDDEGLYISVELDEDTEAEDAVTNYVKVLTETENNKFTEAGTDEDGSMYYASPNDQFVVCPFVDRWGHFYIFVPLYQDAEDGWPTKAISDWISARGLDDELPAYEGTYTSVEFSDEVLLAQGIITVNLPNDVKPEDAASEYCYTLYGNHFSHKETLPFDAGEVYLSPDEEYTVTVSYGESAMYIALEEAERDDIQTSDFPLDEILKYFPTATDLPVITDEDVEYEVGGYEGSAWVYVTYASEELAAAATANYENALVAAGYTKTAVWGSDDYFAYMSKDGTFGVLVDYYQESMSITLYDAVYF